MLHSPSDFEIIDAHTHPFLDFDYGCIGKYGSPQTMEEFDQEMKKVGIFKYAGAPIIRARKDKTSFEEIRHLNRIALQIRELFPAYIPGIHVHGDYVKESCQELHEMYAQGVRLVGELVPYILNTGNLNTPGMMEILGEIEKLAMVVCLHHGTREELEPALKRYPDLKVIIAHPGEPYGAVSSFERFKMVADYENLHMDISGTGLFRWNMLRYAIDTCGSNKMIFGSDMPVCSPGLNLYGALCENLTDEEFSLVLGGNFKRLLAI